MHRFYKMTGSGNDFVMLDGREHALSDWPPERIAKVCARQTGVGADGLVVLTPEGNAQVRMRYFNADGSHANMCGNAALCSTRLSARLGLAPATGMTLLTPAGEVRSRCDGEGVEAEINLPPWSRWSGSAASARLGSIRPGWGLWASRTSSSWWTMSTGWTCWDEAGS